MSTNDGRTQGDEATGDVVLPFAGVSQQRPPRGRHRRLGEMGTFNPETWYGLPCDDDAADDEAQRLARYRLEIAPDDWRRFHTAKDSTS